jgi:hypothetical protein
MALPMTPIIPQVWWSCGPTCDPGPHTTLVTDNPRSAVEQVAAAARASSVGGRLPITLRDRRGITHQPLDQPGAAIEQARPVGLGRYQVGHVVDELVEAVSRTGHGLASRGRR